MRKCVSALCALLIATTSFADTTTGSFDVNIKLAPRPGLCLSETLSALTGASVHVVCESGNFVSIDPAPGRPFLGVHGGAFRYMLAPGSSLAAASSGAINPFIGTGTVTELRLYGVGGADEPLEILISF